MTDFNTDPIRKAVLESESPFRSASVIIGAMMDLLATTYGQPVASRVAHAMTSAIDEATPAEAAPENQQT